MITVQPAYNPAAKPVDTTITSHFFTREARNNFCLQKDDKDVALYVIGLNEKTNTNETGSPVETIRNVATANPGFYLRIQKAMWKDFCSNFPAK